MAALLLAILLLWLCTARPARAEPPGQGGGVVLLLDVVVNGRPLGLVGRFHKLDHTLYATRQELAALGLLVPHGHRPDPVFGEISLSTLPGLAWRLNNRTQTVYITARPAALLPNMLSDTGPPGAGALPVQSGFGAVLNYDLVGTTLLGRAHGGPRSLAEAFLDARLFSPYGVLSSGLIASTSRAQGAAFQRLDTTYSYSDPSSMRRYALGDVIGSGLDWSRPVRLGGIQIGTDFALRPDLVTFPVRSIAGAVAVPSSIDVLVNGVQLLSRPLPPGPFELPQLPVVSGTGDVDVVLRDAAGNETRQDYKVYASNLLLRPGLTAWSAEMGAVRLNYAGPGDSYGAPAGSASLRHGMLDWLTLEAHAEASAGGLAHALGTGPRGPPGEVAGGMAGGTVAVTLGQLGAVTLNGAGSRYSRGGAQFGAGFERITPRFSLSGSVEHATRGYSDVASVNGEPVPRLQLRATAGFSLGRWGSLGAAFLAIRRPADRALLLDGPVPQAAFGLGGYQVAQAQRVSLLSASYTRPILHGRATFYATGFHDFAQIGGTGFTMGFSIALGPRDQAGASYGAEDGARGGTLQASRNAASVGDFGYRVQDDAGTPSRQLGEAEYRAPAGLIDAGVDHLGDQTVLRGSVQGALAVADGAVFAAKTIYDSFAVVDTDGTAGVKVLQENRPVGTTDAAGRLLVTDLRSFDANKLAIDPTDIPADVQISRTERLVRPQDRSGVVVHFPVHASRGALLLLTDGAGWPLPVGSVARLQGSTSGAEVGYDGQAFLTGLAPHDDLSVTLPNGRQCHAAFDFRPQGRRLPRIGPLHCVGEAA